MEICIEIRCILVDYYHVTIPKKTLNVSFDIQRSHHRFGESEWLN